MTGRRPQTTRCFNFIDHFRESDRGANWTSMVRGWVDLLSLRIFKFVIIDFSIDILCFFESEFL